MGELKGPKNLYLGQIGHYKANDEFTRPLHGSQDQVSVPQVPLQGHKDALETKNLVDRENWP